MNGDGATQGSDDCGTAPGAGWRSVRPWTTLTLTAALVLVFVIELALAPLSWRLMDVMGALDPTTGGQQPWRLFACSFLHGTWGHLVQNVVVLLLAGTLVEWMVGHWQLLTLWTVSVLAGSAATLAWSDSVLIGASGGVLGVLAAAVVLATRSASPFPVEVRLWLGVLLGAVLFTFTAQSFGPHTGTLCHVGGAVAGGVSSASGFVAVSDRRSTNLQNSPGVRARVGVGILAGVALLGSLALAAVHAAASLR